jgi:hypothetical protein
MGNRTRLCDCGAGLDKFKQKCRACLAKASPQQYNAAYYRRNRNAGLCGCGHPLADGKKNCQTCLDNQARYRETPKAIEDRKKRVSAYHSRNKDTTNNNKAVKRAALRRQVVTIYGGRCACCGMTGLQFLAIDHVNGDGVEHRKIAGQGVYHWLVNNNYPTGFQVLCHSCNFAKKQEVACPHQLGTVIYLDTSHPDQLNLFGDNEQDK